MTIAQNTDLRKTNKFVTIIKMSYEIRYYNLEVEASLFALPFSLQARYVALSKRMQVYGANLGEPHTKALGDGLFELRLKGVDGIARVFYCTLVGQQIVMLHSYIKKSQKIPAGELRLARSRLKEVKNDT